MTPDIPALREALAAATQGPWHVSQFTECSDTLGRGTGPLQAIQRSHIPGKQTFAQILEAKASIEDMALIALAVNALPGLLDRIEKLERVAEVVVEYLEPSHPMKRRQGIAPLLAALADLDGGKG